MGVRFSIVCLCLITALNLYSQQLHPRFVTTLPSEVIESSGLETGLAGELWTHNDSGDLPRIYQVDTLGNLLRTLNLKGVNAVDFEDITTDDAGNFYIGDFGNNLNLRQDLVIYKIPNPALIMGDSVVPASIHFRYPDQSLFPPSFEDWNFDCEAMFHAGDSLYIFSKNRGTSSFCKMYRLPDVEGTYVAQLVDSFDTKKWISGADINAAGNAVVLLSYDRLWLFTEFTGNLFLRGKAQEVLVDSTQKEGVVFINDSTLYLSDELFMGVGGKLYTLGMESYINGIEELIPAGKDILVSPNPCRGILRVSLTLKKSVPVKILLFDNGGKLLHQETHLLSSGENDIRISTDSLKSGIILMNISSGGTVLFSGEILLKKD